MLPDAASRANAHYNLGVALVSQGRIDEAIYQYRQALFFDPHKAEAHNNLANLLQMTGRLEEAVASYHQALRCRPDCAEAYANLGTALSDLGRLDEAVGCYRQALRLKPDCAEVYNNLGLTLVEQGKLAEARTAFDQAVQFKPTYEGPRWNRSLLWLLHGDFERGWQEYEYRWTQPGFQRRSFPQPLWDGSALAGKTILLHAEQGLGDTLHFLRYVPLVQERGGKVIVECQSRLLPLIARFSSTIQLVGNGSPLPHFDVHAPLLSLPRIFDTALASIPGAVPYLRAEPMLAKGWRPQFHREGLRIGIAWQGSLAFRYDRQRSIPLAQFAPLGQIQGVQLISLQKGPGTEQMQGMTSVLDLGSGLDENTGAFMDTAAVMIRLDLVICCDSAVAHLAGALGVPVWLALPAVPDWRWLLEREDSPWYPTLRLFRQRRQGQWSDVFETMATELKRLASW